MRTLICNGTVIDPASNLEAAGSVLIEDGRIVNVVLGDPDGSADRTIDASGLLVCPGFIDPHVAVREPGFDEDETIESASAAALAGGFTAIGALPDTQPVVDNRGSAEFVKRQAERARNCRVIPLGAITKNIEGKELAEIGLLVEAGAVAFTDAKLPIRNAEVMRRALEYTGMFDRPILHHAVVPELSDEGVMHEGFQSARLGLRGIPAAASDIMVGRDIALAELTGGRVHIMYMSTMDSVERVRVAQSRDVKVTGGVAPHHLLLTDDVLGSFDTMYKCDPPLRTAEHQQALIAGLKDGTITVISADHQPEAIEKKAVELDQAPFGICGLETVLPICVEALVTPSHLTWPQLIACLTTGPAAVLGIPHGTLAPHAKADVTLVDPHATWTIDSAAFRSRSRNTPFDGRPATGRVVATMVSGDVRYADESFQSRTE